MRLFGQAIRLARRELRGGLKGFRVFIACLTLGVAAIATVQSVAGGILDGLRADGRAILGGDVSVRQVLRPLDDQARAWLEARGQVSTVAELRAMAAVPESGKSTLVELKAVDGAYPLYGTLTLQGGGDPRAALAPPSGAPSGGVPGALVEDTVPERLGIRVGDRVRVGEAEFQIRGIIEREPDRAGSGVFSLGPRLMIGLDALPATGLIQPGSLINWTYRVALPPGTEAGSFVAALNEAFPDNGWRVRDFTDAAPQVERFITRLTLFLTLVGLTALLVGGVGVGNAVRAYLDGKTETIATLKCLGASSSLIFTTYLVQILVLAGLGIGLGLLIGAVSPPLIAAALDKLLPVPSRIGVYPGALAVAAGFGLLTALTFSIWPLGRAQSVPAAALFRDAVAPVAGRLASAHVAGTVAAGLALGGLAVLTAQDRAFAAWFVAGSFVTLLAFRGAAWLVARGAASLPRPRRPGLRLAISNLHRPGSPTGSVVLSLGLGLTVLVAIALIEGNFDRRVQETIPEGAPSFFFIDIQPDQRAAFERTVLGVPGASDFQAVPSLRGRVATVNGVKAEDAIVDPSESWIVRNERGMTYSRDLPEGSRLVAGKWWPADYSGPPLISISTDVARAFGIGPGARLGFSILGRTIEAEVANVRDVDFGTLNINFTLVFAPGFLEAAPQTWIATVRATPDAEPAIQRAVTQDFPNVSTIRIKDALDQVTSLLSKIGTAVRLTAAITLVAGTLVLAGAVAAGHRRRVYDSVVLKVLGATRLDVLRAFVVEYGLLGLVTAAIAGVFGTVTAWAVLTWVMEWDAFTFLPGAVATTTVLCTGITLAFGFYGTWRALGQPAAPLLRNE